MSYKKETLKNLLSLIEQICKEPDNKWFETELKEILNTTLSDLNQRQLKTIEKIEKYLDLEGIDSIDYSLIKDKQVKTQLIRDSLEMSKYRLGLINNKTNFAEYCKYGHFQAEELINYFYYTYYNNDINKILLIINANTKFKSYKEITNLSEIDYSFKLVAFCTVFNVSKSTKEILDFIRKMRNKISHRSSLTSKKDNEILLELIKENIDISDKDLNIGSMIKYRKDLCNDGIFIINKRTEDYVAIKIAIIKLKEIVTEEITNKFKIKN